MLWANVGKSRVLLDGKMQWGVFSNEYIPKGKIVWKYDKALTPAKDLELIDKVNHSEFPSLDIEFRAKRNIHYGDEITINYREHGIPVDF